MVAYDVLTDSGHGFQVTDLNGDEYDGLDEGIRLILSVGPRNLIQLSF